eukprot:1101534-Prorocentrum_minimum.AAC.1
MPRWKPWIPPKLDQGLQQGGLFIFEGDTTLLEHFDEGKPPYIPSPLARLVPAAGIFPLPSLDWSPLRGYSLSPRLIGPRCGDIPFPLARLANVPQCGYVTICVPAPV